MDVLDLVHCLNFKKVSKPCSKIFINFLFFCQFRLFANISLTVWTLEHDIKI